MAKHLFRRGVRTRIQHSTHDPSSLMLVNVPTNNSRMKRFHLSLRRANPDRWRRSELGIPTNRCDKNTWPLFEHYCDFIRRDRSEKCLQHGVAKRIVVVTRKPIEQLFPLIRVVPPELDGAAFY